MPLCSFSAGFSMLDVTPVENLFIEEYMRKAPGDFVKVYLYALKLCYHPKARDLSVERMARALDLEEKTISAALTYWARQGILSASQGEQGMEYEFLNLKSVLFQSEGAAPQDTLYRYKDFNQRLQRNFGNRLLKPQDFETAYDWMEVLKLPEEVILLLCGYCVEKKGERVSLACIVKVARGWAKGDIRTVSAAREEVGQAAVRDSDAARILRHIGIRRAPTPDEGQLYSKWSRKWGFDHQAVLIACKRLTRIQSPNFAYLDRVLEGYMQKALLTAQQIEAFESGQVEDAAPVREALYELGARTQSPAPGHIELYRVWTQEWGMDHAAVIAACRQSARRGRRNFDDADHLLGLWKEKGIQTGAQAESLLSAAREMAAKATQVLERAGITRKPTAADLTFVRRWTQDEGFEFELLLEAAGRAAGADNPYKYLEGILKRLLASDTRTLEDANRSDALGGGAAAPAGAGANKKRVDAQNITQRKYTEQEMDELFDTL